MKWLIRNTGELDATAASFLETVKDMKVFAFYGAMGVGKTTFVKALGKALGATDEVSSPTFSIVNEYHTSEGDVFYHFDFYRINNIEEALDFGVEEYFYGGRRCFIEWSEKIEELLPPDTVCCYFRELPDGSREIDIDDDVLNS
ncbi:MAG: tRNA (adenosine(37)-N6)-threonylcarbamoyltransferase complex ATPase subunit type 1 TsaE [Culturomica sp.]|nr:tRNA (adenosine(37)-N6)-threonylcarbamoyltransferase complex ATPase subunit type 1 TsaE [Culturomica sp.]